MSPKCLCRPRVSAVSFAADRQDVMCCQHQNVSSDSHVSNCWCYMLLYKEKRCTCAVSTCESLRELRTLWPGHGAESTDILNIACGEDNICSTPESQVEICSFLV
jgi:hypothetical protein